MNNEQQMQKYEEPNPQTRNLKIYNHTLSSPFSLQKGFGDEVINPSIT